MNDQIAPRKPGNQTTEHNGLRRIAIDEIRVLKSPAPDIMLEHFGMFCITRSDRYLIDSCIDYLLAEKVD